MRDRRFKGSKTRGILTILDKYKGQNWLLSPLDTKADYHAFLKRMNYQLKHIGILFLSKETMHLCGKSCR